MCRRYRPLRDRHRRNRWIAGDQGRVRHDDGAGSAVGQVSGHAAKRHCRRGGRCGSAGGQDGGALARLCTQPDEAGGVASGAGYVSGAPKDLRPPARSDRERFFAL